MANGGGNTRNWMLASIIVVIFAVANIADIALLQRLETIAYDAGVKLSFRSAGASKKIAIIAIDDKSIERIGLWPWPRHVLA
jgi:CHASE2 domain-containing sensor protein